MVHESLAGPDCRDHHGEGQDDGASKVDRAASADAATGGHCRSILTKALTQTAPRAPDDRAVPASSCIPTFARTAPAPATASVAPTPTALPSAWTFRCGWPPTRAIAAGAPDLNPAGTK